MMIDTAKISEWLITGGIGVILGYFGSIGKFIWEFSKETSRRRSETYDKLRIVFDGDEFNPLYEAFDKYAPLYDKHVKAVKNKIAESEEDNKKLMIAEHDIGELPQTLRGGFAAFIEHVALVTKSGLISYQLANYEFGYYAILCWDCKNFWHDLDQDDAYWALYRDFVCKLRPIADDLQKYPMREIAKLKF